jgi:cation diffusion facilitator family transporter
LGNSLLMLAFKWTIGTATHSRALTMSAVYSLHDVIASLLFIAGLGLASAPTDRDHPYGHGQMESVISMFTSLLILAGTVFLAIGSCKELLSGEHFPPRWAAFGAALLSFVVNETIHRYTICAYRKLNSPAILTLATHYRADAVASFGVIFAFFGGEVGCLALDAAVAVFEAGHLLMLSGEIFHHAYLNLMDRSVNAATLRLIRQIVAQSASGGQARQVKTRHIGSLIWLDLHMSLPEEMTLAQAQQVCDRLKLDLRRSVRHLGEVNIIYE